MLKYIRIGVDIAKNSFSSPRPGELGICSATERNRAVR